jgi:hypothetical protein
LLIATTIMRPTTAYTTLLVVVALVGCGGALNNNGQPGTAGTVGTGQAGVVGTLGTGGDIAVGGRGGFNTGGSGGSGGTGGRAGQPWGGDAGFGVCTSWTPPDAPDGGYAPGPPDGGLGSNGKVGCAQPQTCVTDTFYTVEMNDNSLGFTAADLLQMFDSPGTGQLVWYDGTSTTLHFQARYDHPVVYLASTSDPNRPNACPNLEVANTFFSLSTDDGRLTGEEFGATLIGEVAGGAKIFWASTFAMLLSLHGTFRVPDAWINDPSAAQNQTFTLRLTPQSESCSVNCAPSPTASDFAFANTTSICGYDGKIVWTGGPLPTVPCAREVTIAAWQWSR